VLHRGDPADAAAMGVWDSILPGGGRRFIKRKDSDAGEAGQDNELPPGPHPFLVLVPVMREHLWHGFVRSGLSLEMLRRCGFLIHLLFFLLLLVKIPAFSASLVEWCVRA